MRLQEQVYNLHLVIASLIDSIFCFLGAQMRAAYHPYVPRTNEGGNYCGHYPWAPQLSLKTPIHSPLDPELIEFRKRASATDWARETPTPPPFKATPLLLCRTIERFVQFYKSPFRVPELNGANGSDRQMRSERREACIVVMAAILRYTDIVSLRVGIPTKTGFVSLSYETLRKQTHLGEKRFQRAMNDLKAARLITVSQRGQLLPSGKWVGLSAVKAVSKDVFELFGLLEWLKKEREKATQRLKKKAEKWQRELEGNSTRTGRVRIATVFKGTVSDALGKKRSQPKPKQSNQLDLDRRQKLKINLSVKYRIENPDWTAERCNQEAEKEADRLSATGSATGTH